MKKKKIILNKIKKKFKMKPLFDDSDMYETEEIDENVSVEQLDIEINELVKEIKKDMVE